MLLNGIRNVEYSEVQFENVGRWITGADYGERAGTPVEAERLSPVAAAHRIYTNSLAIMPWMIRQKTQEGRIEISHALDELLKIRSNERMSAYTARKAMLSQAFWYGVGYMYIERDKRKGSVKALIPLPSAGAQRVVDPQTGMVWYKFVAATDDPSSPYIEQKIPEGDLLIHRFETYNGYEGRGFLDLAKEVAGTDLNAQKYQERFYSQGAQVGGFVETDANLEPEVAQMVRADIEKMTNGIGNVFRIAVLDNGLKFKSSGLSQRDAQYIESRAFSVDEVCRITGIPAYMLQAGKQSYNSNEQQQLDFMKNTMLAPITQMEQEWPYKLLPPSERENGVYMKLNVSALLRADDTTRSLFYEKMIGIGAFNQDEIRELEDKPPIPDGLGKSFWMSKNYAKIQSFSEEVEVNDN